MTLPASLPNFQRRALSEASLPYDAPNQTALVVHMDATMEFSSELDIVARLQAEPKEERHAVLAAVQVMASCEQPPLNCLSNEEGAFDDISHRGPVLPALQLQTQLGAY